MSNLNWNRSLVIASVIAASICGFSIWFEWTNSGALSWRLSVLTLAFVLSAACVSYSLRIYRFYYILSESGVPITLPRTALAQGVGFALSVAQGSVGELFKLHLIQQGSGTPAVRAAPALIWDRAMEGAMFVLLAILSTFLFPSLHTLLPETAIVGIGLIAIVTIVLGWRRSEEIKSLARAILEKSSFGTRLLMTCSEISRDGRAALNARQVGYGLFLSLFARIADGFVLLFAAQMLGISIALPFAIFVIASSGLAGGVSLLPGGAGAAESTMAGLLMLSGAPWASALAITLLARMSTLWLWVGLGLAIAFLVQLLPNAKQSLSHR